MSKFPSLRWQHGGQQKPFTRAKLAGLLLACVLLVAALAAFLIVDAYRQAQEQLLGATVARARAMMAVIDRDFLHTQAALRALSMSSLLEQGDLPGFRQRALALLPDMQADSVLLLDRGGDMLMSTRVPPGAPLPKLGLTPLLSRTVSSAKPGVSDLFIGPLTGNFLYPVAVPVMRDGQVAMSLNATATPAILLRHLEARGLTALEIVDNFILLIFVEHFVDRIVQVELGTAGGDGLHVFQEGVEA